MPAPGTGMKLTLGGLLGYTLHSLRFRGLFCAPYHLAVCPTGPPRSLLKPAQVSHKRCPHHSRELTSMALSLGRSRAPPPWRQKTAP